MLQREEAEQRGDKRPRGGRGRGWAASGKQSRSDLWFDGIRMPTLL